MSADEGRQRDTAVVVAIVAIVGTKGPFDRLVSALADYARLHPDVRIWVQHGEGALPAGLEGEALVERERVLTRMAEADAVVCHAGSGTLRDAMALGHRPVVVPRRAHLGEHVNDHQLELVEALGDRIEALTDEVSAASLGRAIERARASRGARLATGGAALEDRLRQDLDALTRSVGPLQRARREAVWAALRAATCWWRRGRAPE